MRRLHRLATIVALMTARDAIGAQQVKPAGVVATRHIDGNRDAPFRANLPHVPMVDSAPGHPWRWIGTGALLGCQTGGVIAGVAVSRSDDAFFPGPAIVVVGTAGAVVGGLVGGLSYAISHSARPDLHAGHSTPRDSAERETPHGTRVAVVAPPF